MEAEIRPPRPGDGEGLADVWLDVARYHAELAPALFRVPVEDGLAASLERWATGKLAASALAAQVVGPGLAGLLVRALTAPSAIAIDAAFYLLYAARELGVAPAVIGLAFAAGGAGGLLGAVLAARLAGRFGPGPTLVGAALVNGLGWWPVLAAAHWWPPAAVAATLAAAHVLRAGSQAVFGVNVTSVQQAIVPDHLRGRVAATMRVIGWGRLPLGSLVDGPGRQPAW